MNIFIAHLKMIISAIKTTLAKWTYQIAFIILTGLFVTLYISVPVITIPGNTIPFQLSLYTPIDYVLFAFISVLTSLLVLMQVFSFSRSSARGKHKVGHGSIGIFSGIFSGMFAGITCVPCAIGYIGIFGSAGSVLIVSKYQYYFITATTVLVLWGIYHASRRVMGYCRECNISE